MLEAELGETIIAKRKQLSNGEPVHLSDSRVATLAGSAPRSYLWLSLDGLAKLINRIHTNERAGNQTPRRRGRTHGLPSAGEPLPWSRLALTRDGETRRAKNQRLMGRPIK
jgi:hypothetical protein